MERQAAIGHANVYYDTESNINGGVIVHEDIPELGNVLLAGSCTSIISWHGCIFSKATQGAVNLYSIMGTPFNVEVWFKMFTPAGKLIGELKQESQLVQEGPKTFQGSIKLEGTYEGPTDIVWSPGYAIPLRQVAPGLIEGVYGQTIICQSGEFFHVMASRRYHYSPGRELPFDQVWNYKLLKVQPMVKNGQRRFDYRAVAYYSPLEGEHGGIEASAEAWDDMLSQIQQERE